MRKCELRKRRFNRKSKSWKHKQRKPRNSFTTSYGQAGVQPPPDKQGSVICNSYFRRQLTKLPVLPSSFFFSELYLLTKMPCAMECPWGQLGSAVLPVFPPSSLCTPRSLTGEVGWEDKSLMLCNPVQRECKHPCVNNTISSTNPEQHHTTNCEKNYLSQSQHIISVSSRHAGGNFHSEMPSHVSCSCVSENGQSNDFNQSFKVSFLLLKQDYRTFRQMKCGRKCNIAWFKLCTVSYNWCIIIISPPIKRTNYCNPLVFTPLWK